MKIIFLYLPVLFFFTKYNDHKIENKNKQVTVSLNFKKNAKSYINIKNQLDKAIIINRFSSSIASLILEKQGTNGTVAKILGTPPTPPNNLEKYDTILKRNEQIKISIQGLEILNNLQNIKIRSKIFYKIQGEKKYRIQYSDWYKVDNNSL